MVFSIESDDAEIDTNKGSIISVVGKTTMEIMEPF